MLRISYCHAASLTYVIEHNEAVMPLVRRRHLVVVVAAVVSADPATCRCTRSHNFHAATLFLAHATQHPRFSFRLSSPSGNDHNPDVCDRLTKILLHVPTPTC